MPSYRAKKRLGQNFLKSKEIIGRIISLIDPDRGSTIVEIGPGRGALTLILAQSGAKIIAVEFDRDLIGYLTALLVNYDNVQIIKQDFLELSPESLGADRFKLVGNLPYNITAPVVDWCLKHHPSIESAVFMIQKETALRLAGKPGTRHWSPVSAFAQSRFDVELCFSVPPTSFRPVPKVDSAVVRIRPRNDIKDFPPQFKSVVRAAFKQRRKLLINNLAPELIPEVAAARALIDELGWPANIRAESVSIDMFLNLTNLLISRKVV